MTHAVAVGQSQSGRYLGIFYGKDLILMQISNVCLMELWRLFLVQEKRILITGGLNREISHSSMKHITLQAISSVTYETTNDPLTGKTDGLLKKVW